MEGKAKNALLFSFLCLFSLTIAAVDLHYQILTVNPLPTSSPTLSFPDSDETITVSDSESVVTQLDGDTVELGLHHIDTLSFNETPQALFNLRLQRDSTRVKSINDVVTGAPTLSKGAAPKVNRTGFSSSVVSGLTQGSGEYFTRIGVGTPAKYFYMVLDTGSDVVWLQCAPCRKCYDQTDPIFDPKNSKSFSKIPCGSPLCRKLDSSGCNNRNSCLYQVSYGDGSFTTGEFSTETLTFRRARVARVALGCGHDNEGLFVGAAGLLGLGRGRLSFPSQTGHRFNRKFSYCLVDRSASAKPSSVIFGDGAVSKSAHYTPLVANPKLDTFYYIELQGMSVGGTRVRGITASSFKLDNAGNGGVIVDSGTSVTRLTKPAYISLRDAFRTGAASLKRASDFSLFDTCFDLSGKTEVKVPTVVMHFRGADVSLPATNYLIAVDTSGTFCFAFAGTMSGLSIIGNIQQQGYRVVYDLASNRVGFAPNGCV